MTMLGVFAQAIIEISHKGRRTQLAMGKAIIQSVSTGFVSQQLLSKISNIYQQ